MLMSLDAKLKIVNAMRQKEAKKIVDLSIIAKYPVKAIKEMFVKTRSGHIHVYIHYPIREEKTCPLYVNMHGGGFVKGHFKQDELFCRKVSSAVNCAVMDIDYKTAPEYMFPYALYECYDAVKWAYENAEELGIDKNKIAVGGHSAGANIAIGITLMANEKSAFPIVCQVLDYPPTDLYSDPALKELACDTVVPAEKAEFYTDMYIKEEDRSKILASPVFAKKEQLRGLPPAVVITAELDSLCKEGEKYASMLIASGVEVTARRFLGCSHGFTISCGKGHEDAEKMIFNALRKSFGD